MHDLVEDSVEGKKRKRRNKYNVLRDTVTAMGLCHNVTPIPGEGGDEEYQASSPDEIALVKFAKTIGIDLHERNEQTIKIVNANNEVEEYEILENFPFSSARKRMGIVLRNVQKDFLLFYLKGAESVIGKFVSTDEKEFIDETCNDLASTGLRTLVLSQKLLPKKEYEAFCKSYKQASESLDNRDEEIEKAISLLECNMELLCITGVEDMLQDNVASSIENIRNAGIKVWMLTGDKVETATCIAVSTKLKQFKEASSILYIRGDTSKEAIETKIARFNKEFNDIIIIDGDCLETAIHECDKVFFEVAMQAKAVACCRCSPTQKALVVRKMKEVTMKRCAAIGDGGNDVSMIVEAHLGIGIVGKEGKQASLAADYSITQFDRINGLFFWHGRKSYKNTATICHFVIHRGLIISFIQYIFSIIVYGLSIPIYNGMLILGYTLVYTALPVISLLLDEDVPVDLAMRFPILYKNVLKGRELSTKMFLIWICISIYQAMVIMMGSFMLFEDKLFLKIVSISFSCLIILEQLNVYMQVTN